MATAKKAAVKATALPKADEGGTDPGSLSAADMTKVAGALIQQAAQVTLRLIDANSSDEAKALLAAHRDLTAAGLQINNKAIVLLAGEAKVDGAAIIAAVDQVTKILKTIAEIQKVLGVVQQVLGLVAAVLTGNGTTIVVAIAGLAKG